MRVVSRNQSNTTDQIRVPFALLSSTFWVDKHKQRVGVRNWNNLTVKCVSYMEWCVQTCCQKQWYWWHTATARRKVSLHIWVYMTCCLQTCRTWPSGVTFNKLASSSCVEESADYITAILTCICIGVSAVFWPLRQHILPREAVCDLSEARSHTMPNQRRDSRRDALKETRFSERDWRHAPRRQTPSSPSCDTTRIASLPESWSSCGKPDTCWSCCQFGSTHEPLPEKQERKVEEGNAPFSSSSAGREPPRVHINDLPADWNILFTALFSF